MKISKTYSFSKVTIWRGKVWQAGEEFALIGDETVPRGAVVVNTIVNKSEPTSAPDAHSVTPEVEPIPEPTSAPKAGRRKA